MFTQDEWKALKSNPWMVILAVVVSLIAWYILPGAVFSFIGGIMGLIFFGLPLVNHLRGKSKLSEMTLAIHWVLLVSSALSLIVYGLELFF